MVTSYVFHIRSVFYFSCDLRLYNNLETPLGTLYNSNITHTEILINISNSKASFRLYITWYSVLLIVYVRKVCTDNQN